MHNRQLTAQEILNSCLEIEKTRINRKFVLPRRIVFRLNPDVLQQLEEIKAENLELPMDGQNLDNLRYYILLNSNFPEILKFKEQQHSLKSASLSPSSLTFATNYLASNSPETTVICSEFDLAGQVTQQIQQDLWHKPQLLPRIVEIHHWLIVQILTCLPLQKSDHLSQAIAFLWLIISLGISLYLGFYLPAHIAFQTIFAGLCFYLLSKHLKKIFKQIIRSWSLSYLASSFGKKAIKKRQLAWIVLANLI